MIKDDSLPTLEFYRLTEGKTMLPFCCLS